MQITKEFIEQTLAAYSTLQQRAEEALNSIHKQHAICGFNTLNLQGIDETGVYFLGEGLVYGEGYSYNFPTACLYDDFAVADFVQKIKDSIAKANQAKVDAEAARQAKIKEDQYAEFLRLKNLFGE